MNGFTRLNDFTRRQFLQTAAGAAVAGAAGLAVANGRSAPDPAGATVLSPRGRVPLSFVIDDSTCLVNLGRFAVPQFAEAWPGRAEYQKPWRSWPTEIPDAFVRSFGEWCAERGVKGKYSVVPNPACVGWLDRTLPGWSARALADSLSLVRELMLPNWDLHPEMLTHTRMIDLKTGRPRPLTGPADMENWYPGRGADVSTDELAAYLAAALRVLKNCGLPCTGVTTPGGFGNGVEDRLAVAVREAVGDVFGTENERESDGLVRHFFKYVRLGDDPVAAEVRDVRGLDTDRPECVVTVPAATGDWFGGWTGDDPLRDALYCDADANAGRMVELIERGDPAVMLCHWPGLYNHGAETGFAAFRRIVTVLDARFGNRTVWMKLSEIARYAAAKRHTTIAPQADGGVLLDAPFACPNFTLRLQTPAARRPPRLERLGDGAGEVRTLKQVAGVAALSDRTWTETPDGVVVCFDLPGGRSAIRFGAT
ncbi:twin-arginine translocation signal domain-containing protein [Alienimonas chondri]|uniref:Twin-arginine translocation signal domain-containing protein n=1 Tax=Alienimonas chondri TaxID=2681879 RepID=A0ABX1VHH3_9PLAN|nr:twin-arginine translocation signal domain-containing protein [Alienimonas chondri]NNJ26221.1 hypothetical protein [Alienimonas chondri]